MLFAFIGRLVYGVLPFGVTVAFAEARGFAVAGIASAAFMLAIAVLGPARGRLVDNRGPRALLMLAAACIALVGVTAVLGRPGKLRGTFLPT